MPSRLWAILHFLNHALAYEDDVPEPCDDKWDDADFIKDVIDRLEYEIMYK